MLALTACGRGPATDTPASEPAAPAATETTPVQPLAVSVDRFADVEVLRYEVPGFDELSLREKKLAYYLSQAALAGRDIIYDQNYEHNLRIRTLLAAIVGTYTGDRDSEDFKKLVEYTKRVWFAHGIHHHYSNDKMLPEFTPEALIAMVAKSEASKLPLDEGQTRGELLDMLRPIMFDADVAAKKVTLDPEVDQVVNSATNYYDGVTAAEVERFYAGKVDEDPERPVSWGLNSQLAKVDGEIVERVWKIDGMYGPAIEQIVYWLEKAAMVAENDLQKAWIDKLVRYYRTGDLRDFDQYNIAWVADTGSRVDAVNGFIEVYGDPLGYRGAWESNDRRKRPVVRGQLAHHGRTQEGKCRRHLGQGHNRRDARRRPHAFVDDRHQPAEPELDSQGARLQVGHARQPHGSFRGCGSRRRPDRRVCLYRGREGAQQELRRTGLVTRRGHARGDRPRIRPDQPRRGDPEGDAQELCINARGSPGRSRCNVLHHGSQAR
jgi:hypothetical protein